MQKFSVPALLFLACCALLFVALKKKYHLWILNNCLLLFCAFFYIFFIDFLLFNILAQRFYLLFLSMWYSFSIFSYDIKYLFFIEVTMFLSSVSQLLCHSFTIATSNPHAEEKFWLFAETLWLKLFRISSTEY